VANTASRYTVAEAGEADHRTAQSMTSPTTSLSERGLGKQATRRLEGAASTPMAAARTDGVAFVRELTTSLHLVGNRLS